MPSQRVHSIAPILVNGVKITQVIIDPHYEEKHAGSIDDALILRLIRRLDGRRELPDSKSDQYSYFATLIELNSKQYRLVWLLEKDAIYVGVVNAYRDRRRRS